ncbi:hypothetical protein ABVK25_012368 [Lepraria finkii]|uniref:Uncharacterized protein n=1 Tax=Lepraria finkii TaxID=1340010 RepID=A0ABR4AMA7_9LECA
MLYSPASFLVFNPVQLPKWFRHLGKPLRNRSYLPSETVSSGSHIRISSSNSCLSLLVTQADKFSSFTLNDANNSLSTGFYSPNLSSSLPISHLIPHSSSASSFLVACIEPVSSRQATEHAQNMVTEQRTLPAAVNDEVGELTFVKIPAETFLLRIQRRHKIHLVATGLEEAA